MLPADPNLRLIRAMNASPLTGTGTNTYLLGQEEVVVIDPGPDLPDHRAAILSAVQGARIVAILVTHSHLDHCGMARALGHLTAAPVLAFGPAGSGRSDRMALLAMAGLTDGGEGFDRSFDPDCRLADGEILQIAGQTIEVQHTPGHTGCHLCFAWGDRLFAGDHVMGWSTTLVSPPDGCMTAYVAGLHRLAARNWTVIHPGHGPEIADPAARLAALITHRKTREADILNALLPGPASAATLARRVYTTTPANLLPAATRNVLAHLIDLEGRGLVTTRDTIVVDTTFARA